MNNICTYILKMIVAEGLLQDIQFKNPFKTFRKTQMETRIN